MTTLTADTALLHFYDLEYLNNAFTAVIFDPRDAQLDIFFLVDHPHDPHDRSYEPSTEDLIEGIIAANPSFTQALINAGYDPDDYPAHIHIHNLRDHTAVHALFDRFMGCSDGRNVHLTTTTDPDYDPCNTHPFFLGYNSANYDTTMLAMTYTEFFDQGQVRIPSTADLRRYNNYLFEPEYKNRMPQFVRDADDHGLISTTAFHVHRAMMNSGRHLDIARFNETQSKVGLKRLLCQLGHQVKESDRLSGPQAWVHSDHDVIDLIAYNVSDAIGTQLLFTHPMYSGAFDLRAQLLNTYPELSYDPMKGTYRGYDITSPKRFGKLNIDTRSAQFAGKILAPHRDLSRIPHHDADLPGVSFMYPAPEVAAAQGRTPVNILDETRRFFYSTVTDPTARQQFDTIFSYYRNIEGKNFNDLIVKDKINGQWTSYPSVTPLKTLITQLHTQLRTIVAAIYQDIRHVSECINSQPNINEDQWFILHQQLRHLFGSRPDEDPYILQHAQVDKLYAFIRRTIQTCGLHHHANEAYAALDRLYQHVTTLSTAAMNAHIPLPHVALHTSTLAGITQLVPLFPAEPTTQPTTFSFATLRSLMAMIVQYARRSPYTTEETITALDDCARKIISTYQVRLPTTYTDVVIDNDYHTTWNTLIQQPVLHYPWVDPATGADYKDHYTMKDIPKVANNMTYYHADGTPSSSFATFSIGGIHGAEAHAAAYQQHERDNNKRRDIFILTLRALADRLDSGTTDHDHEANLWADKVSHSPSDDPIYTSSPDLREFTEDARFTQHEVARLAWSIRQQPITIVDPEDDTQTITLTHTDMLTSSSRASTPFMRATPKGWKDKPLFKVRSTGDTELHSDYAYTSIADVVHEDFTSYYPLLLTNMQAFANPDLAEDNQPPHDRYRDIFFEKERYGRMQKDSSYTADARNRFGVLRGGTKLILNSASGAADAGHNTPIRMNNRIISMRIIGQLITWRMAAAQAAVGGNVISTNTDGIYVDIDFDTGSSIIAELADHIGVDIEPEPMTLVSKDANNRVEFAPADPHKYPWDRDVISVGGGLSYAFGPTPAKSMTAPAIRDHILVRYMAHIVGGYVPKGRTTPLRIDEPMHLPTATRIVEEFLHTTPLRKALSYMAYPISSLPSSDQYLFGTPVNFFPVDDRCDKALLRLKNKIRTTTNQTDAPDDGVIVPAHIVDTLSSNKDELYDTLTQSITDIADVSTINYVHSALDLTHDTREKEPLTTDDNLYTRIPHPQKLYSLQHYNRAFLVTTDTTIGNDTPVTIAASAVKKITPATKNRRAKDGGSPIDVCGPAAWIQMLNGTPIIDISTARTHDITIVKRSGVPSAQPMIIFNHSLWDYPNERELHDLKAGLDIKAYVAMAAENFNNSWMNKPI